MEYALIAELRLLFSIRAMNGSASTPAAPYAQEGKPKRQNELTAG